MNTQMPPHYAEKTVVEEQADYEKLYAEAVVLVKREGKASTSFIQRHLQIGYNRAAQMIERMEREEIVTKANHIGQRQVVGFGLEGVTVSVNGGPEHPADSPEAKKEIARSIARKNGIPEKIADKMIDDEQARVDDAKAAAPELPIDDRVNDVGGVSGQRLKAFIERVERLEEEKSALAQDIKEIMGEAKSVGFDTKIIRKVIRLRKMDKEKRQEEEELIELYKSAIGME